MKSMKSKTSLVARTLILAALPACALVGGARLASAQIQVRVFAPPPPTFVATAEPVYYNNQPSYWYQNHWYWRDGGGHWSYYHDEPRELRERRERGEPGRHFEEHRGHEEHREHEEHRGGRR